MSLVSGALLIRAALAPRPLAAGQLVLGITAMGAEAGFDTRWDGRVARPLKACASEISRRLGFIAK